MEYQDAEDPLGRITIFVSQCRRCNSTSIAGEHYHDPQDTRQPPRDLPIGDIPAALQVDWSRCPTRATLLQLATMVLAFKRYRRSPLLVGIDINVLAIIARFIAFGTSLSEMMGRYYQSGGKTHCIIPLWGYSHGLQAKMFDSFRVGPPGGDIMKDEKAVVILPLRMPDVHISRTQNGEHYSVVATARGLSDADVWLHKFDWGVNTDGESEEPEDPLARFVRIPIETKTTDMIRSLMSTKNNTIKFGQEIAIGSKTSGVRLSLVDPNELNH